MLDTIRAAYREETRAFAWERGDVLMLDNFISVHGREPYTGERKVLVAMTATCMSTTLNPCEG
ncbi:TauD/TfdA family dioxygenase [Pseudomonas aeruginosa]|nr:TauD/TfdA family dioxygenase [Pseudomonas aeruginosa]